MKNRKRPGKFYGGGSEMLMATICENIERCFLLFANI